MNKGWYLFEESEKLDTPSLVIYPQRVSHNIQLLKDTVPGVELYPHVKTHKSLELTKMLLSEGIKHFKCATITEAAMLGKAGAVEALLAYQPTALKLRRLIQLIRQYPQTKYACLVDNINSAQLIENIAQENSLIISVYIDLNVGMNRTGINSADAFELFIQLQDLKGIEFAGLHAYDGHRNEVAVAERTKQVELSFEPVEKLRNRIEAAGFAFPKLIAGGSPTFAIHAQRKNVAVSPGTFVFWDKAYREQITEHQFEFAALILTRVISLPAKDKICLDLGYKSIAAEKDLSQRVQLLNAPELIPHSHSEEHLVMQVKEGHPYQIGDLFYALPAHICPSVALYNRAYIVVNGKLQQPWLINARDHDVYQD
ncbi:D-TA family PLP-dependent enzyme [Pedobacter frigiditerrae]|uniref:D-TA family PLP-dependent enzyme n=1 Tax=Pedobacter frigiditerrae TaxID=2530452 RepID=A0A4R0ML59_9SPHI|nr:D-TA family PLP-dependent enzyme [Pedobacter frigiditerrae]TCC87398.1 D-TA family PLP-dependent enzyme [Pedobacter frigiditerrae]